MFESDVIGLNYGPRATQVNATTVRPMNLLRDHKISAKLFLTAGLIVTNKYFVLYFLNGWTSMVNTTPQQPALITF